MINLLPPQQKKELLAEEFYKTIMILGIIMASAMLSLGLMLHIVKWHFASQLEIQKIMVDQKVQQIKIYKVEEEEKKISDYNTQFNKLRTFYKTRVGVTEIIEELITALPSGFYLTNFFISEKKITVNGYCPDRESLVIFKGNLEKQKGFKNVYFAPNSWVTQKNINFNVNFEYEPEE